MSKVIVVVEGGIVQNVYARNKNIEIEVIDLDVADDEEALKAAVKRLDAVLASKTYKEIW